jgi:hypothetical protein
MRKESSSKYAQKLIHVFMWNARHFRLILTKIIVNLHSIKFHENPFRGSRIGSWAVRGRTDGRSNFNMSPASLPALPLTVRIPEDI